MKPLQFVLFALALPALAGAQPIHGNPFKAAYASPAEYPKDGGQCHWGRRGVNTFYSGPLTDADIAEALKDPTKPAHVHVDLTGPRDAEVSAPFRVDFTITAYHLAGQIAGLGFNPYMEDLEPAVRDAIQSGLVWDATGTASAPVMAGDPVGVRTWSGHFTVNPTSHGYFLVSASAFAALDNHDQLIAYLLVPFYSTVDPTQRERQIEGGDVTAACAASSADDPRGGNGTQWSGAVKSRSVLPIQGVPFSRWVVNYISTLYGSAFIPETQASFEMLRGLDFHNGIRGFAVPTFTTELNESGAFFSALMDPTTLGGAGPVKVAVIRHQQSNLARLSTLLVETVTVDPNAPGRDTPVPAPVVTPPTCQSPNVVVNGQCVPPTPPNPTQACTGTVSGTSTNGGATVTVTGGAIVCK